MDNGDRDMPKAHKDFMAISHGNEWVSFYESFDKLVQDNLARSSELLRRAMSLPEIADREVAQIKAEADERIAAERAHHKELLSALQADLRGSHGQVSMLARTVGTVIGDLERLSSRVAEALVGLDSGPAAPAASNAHAEASAEAPAAEAEPEPAQSLAEEAVPAEIVAEAEAALDAMPEVELPELDEMPGSDFDLSAIQAAVEEQKAMLEAAEQHLETLESSIDLNALAEAEAATAPAGEVTADETSDQSAANDQRPRPHWLSVTRVGSRS